MVTVTSVEAQNRFGQLLDTISREPVGITRHGRAAAFIVSPQDMAELLDTRRKRGKALAACETWFCRFEPGRCSFTGPPKDARVMSKKSL